MIRRSPPDDPFDLVGDVIDGQFRVDAVVGEGDLSIVYQGWHQGVDAKVAIKCLNLPATLDPKLVEPFVQSFREGTKVHYRLARQNLNIAQSLASGMTLAPRTGQLVPYLVREWFEGQSLAAAFAERRAQATAPQKLDEVLALLAGAADGLAFAHTEGVNHHSVNPCNLFVVASESGPHVKILDFGVAKVMNDQGGRTAGLRVLLPEYAAPEQIDRRVGELGPWTDVYSFALVVMEALVGTPLVKGKESAPAAQLDPKHRPSRQMVGLSLSKAVSDVLARAVALEPTRRPANVGVFWDALKAASAPKIPPAKKPSLPRQAAAGALSKSTIAGLGNEVLRPMPVPQPPPIVAASVGAKPGAKPPMFPQAAPLAPSPLVFAQEGPPLSLATAREEPPLDSQALPIEAAEAPPAPVLEESSLAAPLAPEAPIEPHAGLSRSANPAWLAIRSWLLRFESFGRTSSSLMFRARSLVLAALAFAGLVAVLTLFVHLLRGRSSTEARIPGAATEIDAGSAVAVAVVTPVAPPPAVATPEASPATPMTTPLVVARRLTRAAGREALDTVFANPEDCRALRGPSGSGAAWVTFEGSGTVINVTMGPPFKGTLKGKCLADRLGSARLGPFHGPPGAVLYRFTL